MGPLWRYIHPMACIDNFDFIFITLYISFIRYISQLQGCWLMQTLFCTMLQNVQNVKNITYLMRVDVLTSNIA